MFRSTTSIVLSGPLTGVNKESTNINACASVNRVCHFVSITIALSLVVHEYSAIICMPEEWSLSVFMTVVCVRGKNDLRIEVCPCGPNRLNSIHKSAQRSP